MTETELLALARQGADIARRHGAEEAKIIVSRSRGVEVEWRDGRLERVQERTRRSLSAELYVAGRYSASSTNDLRPEALDRFFEECVAMTRLLEPDTYRSLPDPKLYEGRADVDLDLEDRTQGQVTTPARLELARHLEEAIRANAGDLPIVSVSTGVSDDFGQGARVHTNGFEGVASGTSFSRSAMITVKEADGRRPMGYSYTVRRHASDLDTVEHLVAEAVDRTRHQLGAGKLATGRYTIVVDRRAVPRLLGAFLAPLSGAALQQKRSLWDGKLGERIASPLLTIVDEPHVPRGLGSALWDGDGFATRRRPLLEEGVLRTYLIDDYYARKLGVAPTTGSTHNFAWAYGDRSPADLIAGVGEGVYLDRFLGGNSNETTGEISLGCAGRLISKGQLGAPVAEANLAGNFAEIWQRLVAVSNDPDPNGAARAPTCVFEGIQLSGV
jgi:PmbA protein